MTLRAITSRLSGLLPTPTLLRRIKIISIIISIISGVASIIHFVSPYLIKDNQITNNKIFRFINPAGTKHLSLFVKANSTTNLNTTDFARMQAGNSGDPKTINEIAQKIFGIQINNLPNAAASININKRAANIHEWVLFDERDEIYLRSLQHEGLSIFSFSLLLDGRMTNQEDFYVVIYNEKPIYSGKTIFHSIDFPTTKLLTIEDTFNPSGLSIKNITFTYVNDDCGVTMTNKFGTIETIKSGFSTDFSNFFYDFDRRQSISLNKRIQESLICMKVTLDDGIQKSDEIAIRVRP